MLAACSDRLLGKVALVTGGGAGIGAAIAARLAAEGANGCITDLSEGEGGASADRIGWMFLAQDVSNERAWAEVVSAAEQRFGRLDILVNNAGILGSTKAATPEDTMLDDWRRVFAVNVEGTLLGCREAIRSMRRSGGGVIVNLASIADSVATPGAAAYGASKAAVRQLTMSVAKYCADNNLNIRCNSVHPGMVRTAMYERSVAARYAGTGTSMDDAIAGVANNIPLGRLTTPEDVAAAVAFLASDDARQITGIRLLVDGGTIECR